MKKTALLLMSMLALNAGIMHSQEPSATDAKALEKLYKTTFDQVKNGEDFVAERDAIDALKKELDALKTPIKKKEKGVKQSKVEWETKAIEEVKTRKPELSDLIGKIQSSSSLKGKEKKEAWKAIKSDANFGAYTEALKEMEAAEEFAASKKVWADGEKEVKAEYSALQDKENAIRKAESELNAKVRLKVRETKPEVAGFVDELIAKEEAKAKEKADKKAKIEAKELAKAEAKAKDEADKKAKKEAEVLAKSEKTKESSEAKKEPKKEKKEKKTAQSSSFKAPAKFQKWPGDLTKKDGEKISKVTVTQVNDEFIVVDTPKHAGEKVMVSELTEESLTAIGYTK